MKENNDGNVKTVDDALAIAGNLFVFQNRACICNISTYYHPDGTMDHKLMIKATDEIINYAYASKTGLVCIDRDTGIVKKGYDAIGDCTHAKFNSYNISVLKKYIEKYGNFSVLPTDGKYYECDPHDFMSIIRQYKNLCVLVTEFGTDRSIDYQSVLQAVINLLFNPTVLIPFLPQFEDHTFTKFWTGREALSHIDTPVTTVFSGETDPDILDYEELQESYDYTEGAYQIDDTFCDGINLLS